MFITIYISDVKYQLSLFVLWKYNFIAVTSVKEVVKFGGRIIILWGNKRLIDINNFWLIDPSSYVFCLVSELAVLYMQLMHNYCYNPFFSPLPNTKVGQLSILEVSPLRNIWWRNNTVSLFRNMEFTSSWEHGGFLELAAILKGRRKQETKTSICSMYSSSDSTIRNTKLKQGILYYPRFYRMVYSWVFGVFRSYYIIMLFP